jgi:dTDP-4-amino-4,6-dideoxygalactose transaminase
MIPLFAVNMPRSVDKPLLNVLHSGYVGQGPKVEEFEQKLKSWLGNEYVLTTITGTAAIHLALRLAGTDPRTSVISTPQTCMASNLPIINEGAKIIWADIDPKTGLIDPEDAERLISTDTIAILCVDWGGTPADLDELLELSNKYGISIIEDACQAFGAEYKGQKIGSIADYSCLSFQAIKTFSTVEGGCLTVKNISDFEKGKLLRWYGIDRGQPRRDFRCEQDVALPGDKWNFNDVFATIGIEALKYVDFSLSRQRENAAYYLYELKERNIKRVKPLYYAPEKQSSFWLFSILTDDRDDFINFMAKKDIQTSRVHERNDRHPVFKQFFKRELPGVDEFCAHQVSIPVGWWLTAEDRHKIMDAIEEWDNV